MCTSSVHYITVELLNFKKWARNINIIIEWIDERGFSSAFEVIAYIRVYWRELKNRKSEKKKISKWGSIKNVKFFRLRG